MLVVHGGVAQINKFIFPSTPEGVKQQELDLAGSDILIGGHCGIPAGVRLGRRAWLNSGAIGLPANDGTRDGWFLLLHAERGRLCCRWQRLSYPVEPTLGKMRAAGFVGSYTDTLQNGLWPSMDILPAAERARRGETFVIEDLLC